MQEQILKVGGYNVKVYTYNTIVVGTGAAGYNAANRLFEEGEQNIAIVTENILCGTSRNTGSDKQTYYKLTLCGDVPDSVSEMAQTLFEGGCVDGDIALCEAAISAQSFFNLVQLGVPFPKNRYGEYVGYKTDHDPRTRATSVGPYTSKFMTQQLEKSVNSKNIKIFNKLQVVKILAKDNKAYGLICLDIDSSCSEENKFVCFNCNNIVYATGGPAGIYSQSVYPFGHYGASGLAFEIGVLGKNLTEWQYGLSSVNPRWNVSGTFMQVLPRFVSTDENGNDEREFLCDFFEDKNEMHTHIFMKGYQWPFDIRKIDNGSSIIDILVFIECKKGRRVFLDFCKNSGDSDIDFNKLSQEARVYLENAKACFGTPIERLAHMNMPAIDFYKDKGVDLNKEMLEIALCAQHNNGGLSIDKWWQTNVDNFFAVGEVAASHGVYRPGGSALNAGQVGSTRAAQYIANCENKDIMDFDVFLQNAKEDVENIIDLALNVKTNEKGNVKNLLDTYTKKMSSVAAAIRNKDEIETSIVEVKQLLLQFNNVVKAATQQELSMAYRLRDILISQYVYMCSMVNFVQYGAKSRGSALYTDPSGNKAYETLPEIFRFSSDDGKHSEVIQEVQFKNDITCDYNWRAIREIPNEDNFFENVWRKFRENKNVF